ncbi:hypothetical protein FLP41_07965 [Paracoccus marcusii]|uniref:hypothetical protein n=1 Tax=Paracoccus marcusii TaxID=59779 RepID=UPI002ED0F435|nr:hypothetical protein FLP41_07965 [Paracoccus marcusii]
MIFNGSRAALPQALARLPDLRVILITAPAEVLARRLADRGREGRPTSPPACAAPPFHAAGHRPPDRVQRCLPYAGDRAPSGRASARQGAR